jgi:hypothetical protein
VFIRNTFQKYIDNSNLWERDDIVKATFKEFTISTIDLVFEKQVGDKSKEWLVILLLETDMKKVLKEKWLKKKEKGIL